MPYGHIKDLVKNPVNNPAAQDASITVVVGPELGWESHVMRVLEIEAGGHTPKHSHPWPHINYVLEGEGSLLVEGDVQIAKAGNYAYVPANTEHQFKAAANSALKFICIVPKEGHY